MRAQDAEAIPHCRDGGWKGARMQASISVQLGALVSGGAVPLLWVIGIVLIFAGVVSVFRGSMTSGVVMVVVGVVLGGLNVL